MAYTPTVWKDRDVENPRTYTARQNEDGSITFFDAPGTINEAGTPVNAVNMNKIEEQLYKNDLERKITNCITEIPQDIKLELVDGVLTLKAGSKVYIPNGVGVFDEVVISADITDNYKDGSETKFLIYYNQTSKSIGIREIDSSFSGTTAPTGKYLYWYDTTNNIIKRKETENESWLDQFSFPVGIATNTTAGWTSIDQVFNGFGYIGSTVFALPGVKGFIPNGRNEDGSLKNIEVTIDSVKTNTTTTNEDKVLYLTANSIGTAYLSVWEYKEDENNTYSNGSIAKALEAARLTISSGKVSYFVPKTAFPEVVHKNLDEVITGYKTFKNSHGGEIAIFQTNNIDSTTAPSATTYTGIDIRDTNGIRIGKVEVGHKNSGVILASLSVSRKINGEMRYKNLSVMIDSSGNGWCENLRPNYGSLVGLGMTLGTVKSMPADGVLFINVQVGSQKNSTVNIYDGSGHAIGVVKHNGGSAELNCSTFTAIVAKGQSINCSHNGAGTAAIVSSYLAPWR